LCVGNSCRRSWPDPKSRLIPKIAAGQEGVEENRWQDKKPHIAAQNGCLFSKAWNPIPQCAWLSVNVREGPKGRVLIGNSMG
jgi:hypothetical protein